MVWRLRDLISVVSHMLYQLLARGKVYCVLPMSIYFKTFHFPLRKEVTDTEIGQKQQVILSYILKKKKKAITMSTSLSPKKGQKKELAVLLSIAIEDNGSQTVSIMLKKSNN